MAWNIRYSPSIVAIGGGGDLVHGSTATATGSGFGSRSASFEFFDNHTAVSMSAAGYGTQRPFNSTAAYNTKYRTPAALGRGVSLAHNRATNYICGAHYNGVDGTDGSDRNYDCGFDWFDYTKSLGTVSYLTWLERCDPSWVVDLGGSPGDNNWKYFYINGPLGFADEPGIYCAMRNDLGDDCPNGDMSGSWNTQGTTPPFWNSPDINGINNFWNQAYAGSNVTTGWIRREIWWKEAGDNTGYYYEVIGNRTTSGFFKDPGGGARLNSIQKNKLVIAYEGVTDGDSGTSIRSTSIGGYYRGYGNTVTDTAAQNNWRYWMNPYCQRGTYARVMLGNNATYSSATLLVPQPINTWSGSSINYDVYGGELSNGTVYEYVFDATNALIQTTARTLSG